MILIIAFAQPVKFSACGTLEHAAFTGQLDQIDTGNDSYGCYQQPPRSWIPPPEPVADVAGWMISGAGFDGSKSMNFA